MTGGAVAWFARMAGSAGGRAGLCAALVLVAIPLAGDGTAPAVAPPPGGATEAGSGAGLTAAELVGTWAGDAVHQGQRTALALHLEAAEDGKLLTRLSIPVIHVSRSTLGPLPLRIEGSAVTLGPFSLRHDRAEGTLTGTLPPALVPVHEIPVTLRRVDRFQAPRRRPLEAPEVEPAWTFDAGSPLWAGASFAEGMVFAGGDDGRLHAVDARTGERRWSFATGGAIRARATVVDGELYVQADDGVLYTLSARSGEERWRARVLEEPASRLPPEDPKGRYDFFASEVAVAGGRLFVGTHDGKLLALDRRRGSRLWEVTTGDSILAAPAVASGKVFAGSYDGHVYAVDAASGAPRWEHDTGAPVVSAPAVAGGLVIIGSRSYDLLALDAATGEPAWSRYLWFSWIDSSAAVHGGMAYVGSSDAAVVLAVNADTGHRVWSADVRGRAWGRPAVTRERVYVGTSGATGYISELRGGVVALDRRSGRPVWRFTPAAEEPTGIDGFAGSLAVGEGLVFAAGLDGRLRAFRQ